MEKLCPQFKTPCKKDRCKFWTHLLGKDHNTGKEYDSFDCAIIFLPILLVEAAYQSRGTAAAIESFRNVMADPKGMMGAIASGLDRLGSMAQAKLISDQGGQGEQTPH